MFKAWGTGTISTTATNNLVGSIVTFAHPNRSSGVISFGADVYLAGSIAQSVMQLQLNGNSMVVDGSHTIGDGGGGGSVVRGTNTGTVVIGGDLKMFRGGIFESLPGDVVHGSVPF